LLSSLVTGSGDSKRELYTTDSEYAFKVKRPVIVNGINFPSEKADLLSRFVALEVPPIEPEERVTESKFWEEFEEDRGKLLGAFFDMLSGVLRHRKPLGWASRLSDWGELASAMYEHLGWGRDMFKLDYSVVEGKQHDDALEGLVGEHVVQYLYAEFDDGKDVLLKAPKDLWEEVKMRVPLESRRWFPTSSNHFGRELNRLKQALAHKGFDIGRGTIGTGNAKRNVIKVARIDDVGSMRVDDGSTKSGSIDPAENGLGMPESPRRRGVWVDGSTKPLTSSGRKKKKYGRNSKRRAKSIDPVDPAQPKQGESGVDKPKNPGSTNREFIDPLSTQNGGHRPRTGWSRPTRVYRKHYGS
jgi:hypothetical protein